MPSPSEIEVSVNGEPVRLPAGSSVSDLLRRLGLDTARVAVELNLRVVPRAEHPRSFLGQGDRLEIVSFVGGGTTTPRAAC